MASLLQSAVFPLICIFFNHSKNLKSSFPFQLWGGGGGTVRPPPCGFLPLAQKIFIKTFYCGCPFDFFSLQKCSFTTAQSNFGTPSTKVFLIFLLLIKKIFLQTLVEIIFRDHQKFCFDPLGPPYKQNEEKSKFHIWSVGYQNRVSERIFGKYSKMKILVLKFLQKVNF